VRFAGGDLHIDFTHEFATLRTALSVTGRDLDTRQWSVAQPVVQAPFEIEFELVGVGASSQAIAANVDGKFVARLGAGTLTERSVGHIGDNLFAAFLSSINPLRNKTGPTPIACATAQLIARNGKIQGEQLLAIQTGGVALKCDGEINLRGETANLNCRPTSVRTATLAVPAAIDSVSITGTLAAPEINVIKAGILHQGVSLGGGITTHNLHALSKVLGGGDSEIPCRIYSP
jgi:hypothetical protein